MEGKTTVESVAWLQADDWHRWFEEVGLPVFHHAFIILFFLLYRILLISVFIYISKERVYFTNAAIKSLIDVMAKSER